MKNTKPIPGKSKLALREPAKPLEERQIHPDHPAALIFAEVQRAQEAEAKGLQTQMPETTHQPPPTYQPPPTSQAIAPQRDFMRVPNSVVRDAMTAGLFKGESKKLYDALYQRTRGAVVPRRSIRATQADLMDWAHVSHNTLKAHIKHLSKVGLLKVHYVRGDNTGAEYEIFTPEEAPPTTHHPQTTQQPTTSHNLVPPTNQNSVLGGGGQEVEKSTTSENSKTSFKTNTERNDDDAALAGLVSALKEASKELTGKELSPAEVDRWRELAEVLITEAKIAAARTTVSSLPAFMAEHLRRRLWKKDKNQLETERRTESQTPTEQPLTEEQIKSCQDCGGSTWYYPEGTEKGIKRCRHEKIRQSRQVGDMPQP
jgi:hypothetical protein